MKRYVACLAAAIFLSGCASSSKYDAAVDAYAISKIEVRRGMSESRVLSILGDSISQSGRKSETKRLGTDRASYTIHYARSAVIRDGHTTDNEFVPYIFRDGRLIANDWGFLGGMKSVGDPNNDEIGNWRSVNGSVTIDDVALALYPCEATATMEVRESQARDEAARKKTQNQTCNNNGWGQQTCVQNDSDPWGMHELGRAIGSISMYRDMYRASITGCMAKNGFLRNE